MSKLIRHWTLTGRYNRAHFDEFVIYLRIWLLEVAVVELLVRRSAVFVSVCLSACLFTLQEENGLSYQHKKLFVAGPWHALTFRSKGQGDSVIKCTGVCRSIRLHSFASRLVCCRSGRTLRSADIGGGQQSSPFLVLRAENTVTSILNVHSLLTLLLTYLCALRHNIIRAVMITLFHCRF